MARKKRVRPRLLVVEDEEAIREALALVLEETYRVSLATCGREALELLHSQRFDLVLLDLNLPDEPRGQDGGTRVGYGVLKTIRAKRMCKGTSRRALPVVVMTAHADGSRQAVAILVEHGANDYLPKNHDKAELLSKLERALLGRGALVPSEERGESEVRLAFDLENCQVYVETLPPFSDMVYDLLSALRENHEAGVRRRCAPEKFDYLPAADLRKWLGLGDRDEVLRRRILRVRRRLQKLFEDTLHRQLDDEQVIESKNWRGYRLNPRHVRLLEPSELAPDAARGQDD